MTTYPEAAVAETVEVWTDLVCPWCYLGKHRLDRALAQRPDGPLFTVLPRSFELDPSPQVTQPLVDWFTSRKGVSPEQFLKMETGVRDLAHSEGLPYVMERPVGNTFEVHRVLQLANERTIGRRVFSAIQDSYFAGDLNPFDRDQLATAAVGAGLPSDDVARVLDSQEYAEQVRADQAEARSIGITSVPFAVFGRRLAVVGAQPSEVYADALNQIAPVPSKLSFFGDAEGAVCDPATGLC